MSYVNVRVRFRERDYEVELDDTLDPRTLARNLAEALELEVTGREFKLALIQGKGIVEGAYLELLEGEPPTGVRIKSR